MTILGQKVGMDSRWRTICELTDGSIVAFETSEEPTMQELLDKEIQWIAEHQYDNLEPIEFSILNNVSVDIEMVIYLIKQNPSLTFTQYNSWLANQSWEIASFIRFFLYKLSAHLANKNDIIMSDYSEPEVLLKLRNWILASSPEKLRRVIFNL